MSETKLITQLTKEQESTIPQFVDKWLKIGLSTSRIDRPNAIKSIHDIYRAILDKKTTPVVFLNGPIEAYIATLLFYNENQVTNQVWNQVTNQVDNQVTNQVRNQVCNQVDNQVRNQVENQVRNQVTNQVWNQVWNQVCNQVDNQVRNQVENQVRNQVTNQVWNQVRNQVENQVRNQVCNQVDNQVTNQIRNQVTNQVWNQVKNQVRNQVTNQVWNQVWNQVCNQVDNQVTNQIRNQVTNQVWNQVKSFIWPYLDGHLWSSWFTYYDFMRSINVRGFTPKFDILQKITDLGLIYPLDNICIVSEKPIEIHMRNGVLHNEKSASVVYADGTKVWSLNGVRVSQEIVETQAENLDAHLLLKERNAEVRREIVRKIGIERICVDLSAECIDRYDVYELLLLDISDNRKRPYLKMRNPSIGIYHIEGVAPEIKTVAEALKWRNQSEDKPIILT